jgi:dienelactone hydrolase/nicotinamidase-related amidase/type 1 glutamine amidotransferase
MTPARLSLRLFAALASLATLLSLAPPASADDKPLQLSLRSRVPVEGAEGRYAPHVEQQAWEPARTAVIVCDMWNDHWCRGAAARTAELAPAVDRFVSAARQRGVLVIHAPSGCMEAYANRTGRRLAMEAPRAADLPEEIGTWCRHIPAEEAVVYPVDQQDGGCDCFPRCAGDHYPWTRQHDAITICPHDAISDSGEEIWNLLAQRGIDHVMLLGVHTNMCVLGRPFGLRNLARHGKQVVLVRDLTDTMYNSRAWPYVNHFTGTDRIVEHIEQCVCPTITSDQLTGEPSFRFAEDTRKRLVMVVAEDEYRTEQSLPDFARRWLGQDFAVDWVFADPAVRHSLPGIAALDGADVALISVRRRVLPEEQMAYVRRYIESGKPVVGIRTASHAFALRQGEEMPAGCVDWPAFDHEVLGCNYQGHHGNLNSDQGRTFVWALPEAASDPLLIGVPREELQVTSWLYKSLPLAPTAHEILRGRVEDRQPHEPVAWTNTTPWNGRVFYTSLGHVGEFAMPAFNRLLVNGIYWAAGLAVPQGLVAADDAAAQAAGDARLPQGEDVLPGTRPLTLEGDIASYLVEHADRFLLSELDKSIGRRARHWNRDQSSAEAYNQSLEPNRQRLAHILGVRDARVPFDGPELVGTTAQPALVGRGENFEAYAIRWPAFGDVHGEGLLLVPTGREPVADVVAIPDADQLPEQIAGLVEGVPAESQFARRLAESGCRVVVPVLIDRHIEARNGRAQLTNREFAYRSAFELGRHLIGYELQKVLAAIDWFEREAAGGDPAIGVMGYGEGGMLALYAAALDTRIDAATVSGYFGNRQDCWQQPLDRNVFGLLDQFGDAELASMVYPRKLSIEGPGGPELTLPGNGGAPSVLASPSLESFAAEAQRANDLVGQPFAETFVRAADIAYASDEVTGALVSNLRAGSQLAPSGSTPQHLRAAFDPAPRQAAQLYELDRHSQWLLRESPYVRDQFMQELDTSALPQEERLAAHAERVEKYRQIFRDDVIGRFEYDPLPANPRTRKAYDTEKWTGYEVVLDVFPDVIAYGVLLVPKDIQEGERRPVVVCQHGLEGRPQDIIAGDHPAYHDFASKLAERGFITFSPQNLYIFTDRFRTLQRKANPLGKTLFSLIVPQHQQIVDWLQTLPYVDPDRVGFYGLSYGGKSAMRIPSLVTDYCLSICSADFNEWVLKNASTRAPFSYMWAGEYEIFEFDLGSTFNYAEMAALICPRPFMVERGHFDGVGLDEYVSYEFAKVRYRYQAQLGIGDRTEIEYFVGPHTINGVGTYQFLHKHLNWPEK